MRRFLPVFLLTVLPASALAATGDVLLNVTEAWEDVEQVHVEEELQDTEDEQVESSAELFPADASSSEGSVIDNTREERTSEFISATVDGQVITFADVPRTEWFAPYIRDIAERGIVSGYRDAQGMPLGRFGPADHVTVEQLAKIVLASSANLGDCQSQTPVNLSASGSWSAGYVACAEALKWTVYADGSVDAHRDATRAEVVVTLLEAFKTKIGEPTGTAFTDVTITTLFNAVIEQAKNDGIVSGYTDASGTPTGLFGPGDPVNRAELAKIVTLAIQVYGSK